MLLRSDPVSSTTRLTRSDSAFVLLLTLSLVLAASSFFTPFALAALLAGVPLSVALHRHADFGASDSSPDRLAGINIASIHVGGDVGGLIFVLGSIAIVMLGLPSVRWFLIASIAAATVLAIARISWRERR